MKSLKCVVRERSWPEHRIDYAILAGRLGPFNKLGNTYVITEAEEKLIEDYLARYKPYQRVKASKSQETGQTQ